MRKSAYPLPLVAVLAAATTACVGFQSGKSSTPASTTAPTATSPTPSASGALVGTWGEQAAFTVPPPSSCGNFQWQITSQTDTSVAGTFSATCGGGVAISGSGTGVLNSATTVGITVTGDALVGGIPACHFTLNGVGTLSDDKNTLTIPYTGDTCVGPVRGTEALHRNTPTPPAPAPSPQPAPDPVIEPPPSGSLDAIDMGRAIILNSPRDIASWPITTRITAVSMGPAGVHVEFDKQDGPGRWPDVTPPGWDGPLQYTLGMAENIGGQWYASAVIEFWYGLYSSGGPPSQFASNWFYDPSRWAPMTYHQPQPGELIGFYVCEGDCRNNPDGTMSPLRERSNIVLVPMPANDSGGVQTFRLRR